MRRMTKDIWLVPEQDRTLSPYCSPGAYSPAAIVVHWTASPSRGGADRARVERWLQGKSGRSSTHFVILRDGTLLQGVPIGRQAWHAGASLLRLGNGAEMRRCNEFSVGIDFENIGPLTHKGGGRWLDCYGGTYDGPKPEQRHEPYTDAQIATAVGLFEQLGEMYPLLRDDVEHRVVGHSDVSPGRKIDPGPLCPWDVLRAAVMARGVKRP